MSNIFQEEQTPVQTPTAQGDDALATKLSSIVNEQGEPKYANVETALDALKHSQEFIPSLKNQVTEQEAEIAKLREQVAKQSGVQEALERFAAQPQAQPQVTEETPTATLGEQDVTSLVQNVFKQHLQTTQEDSNFEQVQNALVEKHGDQASNFISKRAKELGTTASNLEQLSRTNPTMVLELLKSNTPAARPTSGGTNTTSFAQPQSDELEKPSFSMKNGVSSAEAAEYMRKVRDNVYKKHGITQ